MFEEAEVFERDDNIIFKKNSITLQKIENENTSRSFLKKKLRELDGNWELDIIDKKNEISTGEEWVSDNEDNIFKIFVDLRSRCNYTDILSNLTFNNLCSYLEACSKKKYKNQINKWEEYEEHKLYGLKNPSITEWTAFHVIELHYLYNLCTMLTRLKFGTTRDFSMFCFENSCVHRLPQY